MPNLNIRFAQAESGPLLMQVTFIFFKPYVYSYK